MKAKRFSVFYKDGDEANSVLLTHDEALKLAHNLESDDYEVLICELVNNAWEVCYDTTTEREKC